MPREPRNRLLCAVLAAVVVTLTVAVMAQPAQAALVQIQLTQNGPQPPHRTIASGDRVQFVNTDSFPHSLKSSTPNWSFTIMVNPGQASAPIRLTVPGTYGYQGTNFDTFTGDVRIPSAGPSPSASPSSSPVHSAGPTAGPSPTSTPSAPGSARPSPSASPHGPRPHPGRSATPGPRTSAVPSAKATPVSILVIGAPPEPPTSRRVGLPAALAAVAVIGAASLFGRALLAHPAARHPA